MILIGYIFVLVALAWVVKRGRSWRIPERLEVPTRTVATALDALFLALGIGLLARREASALGDAILLSLIAGATVYLWGLTLWRGRSAQICRVVGWSAMTVALLVPTTISLALPLLALLAPTLAAPARARRPAS